MAANRYLLYEKRNSWVERWDPRYKIAALFVFGLSLLITRSLPLKTAELLVLVALWAAARLPWRTFAWTLLSLGFFFVSTMVYRAWLAAPPGDPQVEWGFVRFSEEGALSGIMMCEQIAGIVLLLSVLVRTTSPIVLAEGLERLLSPLKRWKVPVHDGVMMFSIALRFVPLLLEEFDTIRKAQIARGGGFHRKGALSRFRGVFPMLLPLFVLSIQRAKDLAVAMESRGYRGDIGRTPIRVYRARKSDYAVLSFSMLVLAAAAATASGSALF